MKYSMVETLMGMVVILTAVLFLIFGLSLEKKYSSGKIELSAIFENVSGLNVGDKVKLSGIDIGKITNFELEKDAFEVRIKFDIVIFVLRIFFVFVEYDIDW